VNLGLGGAPDVLHAVYGRPDGAGRLRGVAGDSYVLLVEWDRNGRVSSRSVHQYGSATRDASSVHYADQALLFAQCKLKPVWFDEAEVRAHLEREYSPGEEAVAR
jgi:penicillin amidase/acyl-homoserine-lactone acylase